MTDELDRLKELTAQLLEYNRQALKHFEKHQMLKENGDFIKEVKPFADEVNQSVNEWINPAVQYVRINQTKYLHPQQLEAVHENIEIEAVTCFQADTKKKRFRERNKSIEYTLDLLHRALNGEENKSL